MEYLIHEARAIFEDAEAAGLSIALLGGLAVRAWVGPIGRETFDIDLVVASNEERDGLGRLLERRGYAVLDDPWWRRAVRGPPSDRLIVDWTGPDVVNPKTLERFHVAETREHRPLGGISVPVIGLLDLLVLKLLAARDQDAADVVLLLGVGGVSSNDLIARTRAQGLAKRVSDEASRLRFGVHTGATTEAAERLLGRELGPEETSRFEQFLETLMEVPT